MKILVTGGAGFIGSNFIHYLINTDSGYQIYCLDKLTYAGNLNNINTLIDSNLVTFIKGDVSDEPLLSKLFEKYQFDVVINFAAESHVDRSITGPKEFIETNYIGVFNLLEQIRKYPNTRFHQVSTDEVYGDLPLEMPELKFNELSPFKPSSPYSSTKAGADLLVKSYFRTFNLKVTISHASNNYGKYQFPEKLIPLVIHRANLNKSIPVYGTGENVRDWIHVDDHCSALELILRNGKFGETYNIGGENEMRNIDVIRMILSRMQKPYDLIEFVKDRSGHDLRYAIEISKIKSELGWQPTIRFEDGISETIKWYLESKAWLEAVISEDYKSYYSKNYGD